MDSNTDAGLTPAAGEQREETVEQLMSQPSSAMCSCRKVVDSYRAVLTERQGSTKSDSDL